MRKSLIIAVLVLSLLSTLLCGMLLIGTRGHRDFMLPLVVSLLASTVAGVWRTRDSGRLSVVVQSGLMVLALVFFVLTVKRWPGGDDGGGMMLVGGIGPMVCSATILTVLSTIYYLIAGRFDGRGIRGIEKPVANLAAGSLAASCLGVFMGPVGSVAGIVCGHVARRQIRQRPELGGAGIALAGIVIGYTFLVTYLALAIVIAWHCCRNTT